MTTVQIDSAIVSHAQIEDAIVRLSIPAQRTASALMADADARVIWQRALATKLYTADQAQRMSRALHARLNADRPASGPCAECGDFWPLGSLDQDGICPECLEVMAEQNA